MKILHVVNSFDPSADVVRCVRELNKHSRHMHTLFVRNEHPGKFYAFEQAAGLGDESLRSRLLEECDAILYQFTGHQGFLDAPNKPAAFRNINIYWDKDTDKFWSHPTYNAPSFERYSQIASSHAGAIDFLPQDRFTWLPDLLPQEGPYALGHIGKKPRVSFIKHAEDFLKMIFPGAIQDLTATRHEEVLRQRRELATVLIDNVCDGHWGLSGHEGLLMGLPVIVFNHDKTKLALENLTGESSTPFVEVGPDIEEAAEAARRLLNNPKRAEAIGRIGRDWAVDFLNSKFLIEQTWDPFFDKLIKS